MVRARSNAALPQPGSPLSRGAQGGLTSPMRGLQHPASGAPQPLAKRSGCVQSRCAVWACSPVPPLPHRAHVCGYCYGRSFRLMAQDSKALVALFGVDIAAMIRGEDWRGRREGLWLAAEQINAGTVGSPPTTGHRGDDGYVVMAVSAMPTVPAGVCHLPSSHAAAVGCRSSHPAWHTVLELLKAALMDAKPQVNIASLDVLQAVLAQSVDVVLSDAGGLGISGIGVGGTGGSGSSGGQKDAHSKPSPVAIPWGDWEARLGLGSFVKTVMDKTSDPHVRVRSVWLAPDGCCTAPNTQTARAPTPGSVCGLGDGVAYCPRACNGLAAHFSPRAASGYGPKLWVTCVPVCDAVACVAVRPRLPALTLAPWCSASVAIAADDLTSAMALAKTSRVLVGRLRCLRELLDMQEREGGVGTGGGTGALIVGPRSWLCHRNIHPWRSYRLGPGVDLLRRGCAVDKHTCSAPCTQLCHLGGSSGCVLWWWGCRGPGASLGSKPSYQPAPLWSLSPGLCFGLGGIAGREGIRIFRGCRHAHCLAACVAGRAWRQ